MLRDGSLADSQIPVRVRLSIEFTPLGSLAVGQFAVGQFAVGQFAVGQFAVGQFAVGQGFRPHFRLLAIRFKQGLGFNRVSCTPFSRFDQGLTD